MTTQFFTTFQIGWLNSWIPTVALLLIQYVFMLIYKTAGKRAIDTSWYTSKDKLNANISFILLAINILVSVFIPLKIGTLWFTIGSVLYAVSFIAFILSFYAYATTPHDKTVTKGIYKLSRNPMYFVFGIGTLAICIASASLWMLLIFIPYIIVTHLVILGEERYCKQTYGESYLQYKANTPRYFLIK